VKDCLGGFAFVRNTTESADNRLARFVEAVATDAAGGVSEFVNLCHFQSPLRLATSDVFKVLDSLTEVKRKSVEISEKGSKRHNSHEKATY
jgi:hypothetical protein